MPERKSETYIPPEILAALQTAKVTHNWTTTKKYNSFIQETFPNVPKSTRTRWTRAFVNGLAHSETPTWHKRYQQDDNFVPLRFSAIRSGRIQAEREKWRVQGGIRYANISDFHRPYNDGALLTLGMDIIKDFEPNVFPAMSDWFDMTRFNQHAPRVSTAGKVIYDDYDEIVEIEPSNKLLEFKGLVKETVGMVKEVVPDDCSLINLFGNHEAWLLRYLLNIRNLVHGADDLVDYFINDIFTFLEEQDILWCEQDQLHWLPLTKEFFVGHGHKARGGLNRTANAYLNSFRNSVSVAVGHSHRQELVQINLPYGGERFAAVAGTMGQLQPTYANRDFLGHNMGFQLIEHPIEGNRGVHVENVRIRYQDGYYVTTAFGKEYSQMAGLKYDEYMDFAL